MNYISIFIMSFTIALLGALAPGPLLTAVIARTPTYGFKTGPLLMIGHAIAEILMVLIILSGFSRFIHNSLSICIIAFVGGVVMILFGLGMLKNVPSVGQERKSPGDVVSNLPFLGITLSLTNPYWTVWWLTIGLSLVLTAQKAGVVAICIFFMGHILADVIWYSIVSFTVSKGKKFITDKVYNGIMKTCGLILIGFGIYFLSGFFKLRV